MGKRIFVKLFSYLLIFSAIIACVFFNFKLKYIKNQIDSYTSSNENLNDTLNNLLDECDSLEKQLADINEFEDKTSDIENSISAINGNMSSLENNYVEQSEVDSYNEKLDHIINKDYSYNANGISDAKVDEVNNSTKEQTKNIRILENTKVDVANKVSEYNDSTTEDNYFTSEFVNDYFDDKYSELIDEIYPIGSLYISYNNTHPDYGTWELLDADRVLWNSDEGGLEYIAPSIPNIKGAAGSSIRYHDLGSFMTLGSGGNWVTGGSTYNIYTFYLDLSRANSIYKDGATVRPPVFAVTVFKRVS